MEIKLIHAIFFKNRLLKTIMKSFIFLFCALAFGFTPGVGLSQNAIIEIDADKTITVDEVFKLIQNQTNYKFIYRNDLFNNAPMVGVKEGSIITSELLEESLEFSDIQYDFLENTIILSKKTVEKVSEEIQQITLTGTVSSIDGATLPGVSVLVGKVGTKLAKGVVTDFNGKFKINAVKGNYIRFSYIGYVTQEFIVDNQTEFNILLKEATTSLDEVVINAGYYKTSRKLSTGNIGTVKAEAIGQQPVTDPIEGLKGKIAGLQITQNDGLPGAAATVRIRGINSLNSSANLPMYILDGVPIPSSNVGSLGGIAISPL